MTVSLSLNDSLYESPVYLAGVQHVSNGPSAEVGRGNDVFLTTRVPSSHCLRCCHSDSFSHANELLGCGCLCWWVRTAEHLCGKTRGLLVKYLIQYQTWDQCSKWIPPAERVVSVGTRLQLLLLVGVVKKHSKYWQRYWQHNISI